MTDRVSAALDTAQLREAIAQAPRVRLAHLPTPLEEARRFAPAIGASQVFLKRDDCTGLAFGGNKTRHNEFLLAHALEQGADTIAWGAGVQSNNCRQTAAACALLGLECRLFLSRGGHDEEVQGNLLLDHILGAAVQIVDEQIGPDLDERIAAEADRLRAAGRKVYGWDRAIVKSRAAISYVLCLCEIVEQLAAENLSPAAVYVCSAGSTGAGLELAKSALGLSVPIRHIAPIRWPWDLKEDMAHIANEAAELLGFSHRVSAGDLDATEDYVGEDYGVPTPDGMEALRLLARTEGVILDPVYTAKALAALIADARAGRLPEGPVVFVHTGGTPAVFAYRDEIAGSLDGATPVGQSLGG